MYVSRDDFLKALTITEEDFEVAGLGTVRIKPLSLSDRAAIQKANTGKDGQIDVLEMQTAALIAGMVEPKLTGEDVTECTGGARGLSDLDLQRAYKSTVDPRLNYEQSLELAMLIADRARAERRRS